MIQHIYRPDPTLATCVRCGGRRLRCQEHPIEVECWGECRYQGWVKLAEIETVVVRSAAQKREVPF